MKETLKQDLQALRCEGNIAYLPTDHSNDYAGLKKVLIQATGKYKKNTFVFPSPAQPIIDQLISGDSLNFKKDFQFFATPQEVAEEMVNRVLFGHAMKILEPSAGQGALIDEVLKRKQPKQIFAIDAVEIADLNANILHEKYQGNDDVKIYHQDFIEFKPVIRYDLIIANPPFTKNQDIDHIMKMWDLLDDGGQLITLASKSWTFGSQKKQVDFRQFLEDEEALFYEIPAGKFKESGTNIAVMLIDIRK